MFIFALFLYCHQSVSYCACWRLLNRNIARKCFNFLEGKNLMSSFLLYITKLQWFFPILLPSEVLVRVMILLFLLFLWNHNQNTLDPGRQNLELQKTPLLLNTKMAMQELRPKLFKSYSDLGIVQQKLIWAIFFK